MIFKEQRSYSLVSMLDMTEPFTPSNTLNVSKFKLKQKIKGLMLKHTRAHTHVSQMDDIRLTLMGSRFILSHV